MNEEIPTSCHSWNASDSELGLGEVPVERKRSSRTEAEYHVILLVS